MTLLRRTFFSLVLFSARMTVPADLSIWRGLRSAVSDADAVFGTVPATRADIPAAASELRSTVIDRSRVSSLDSPFPQKISFYPRTYGSIGLGNVVSNHRRSKLTSRILPPRSASLPGRPRSLHRCPKWHAHR